MTITQATNTGFASGGALLFGLCAGSQFYAPKPNRTQSPKMLAAIIKNKTKVEIS